jgi:RHS repeat-associated protein
VRVDRLDQRLDGVGGVVQQAVISTGSEYDAFNRKTADIDALGNRVSYRYDSRDLLRERRDARGNVTSFDYDRYGRKMRRTDLMSAGQPIVADYSYDDDGNMVRLDRSGGGQAWSAAFAYDALNRKVGTVLAPGTAAERRYSTSYDPSGNIHSHTRATGLSDIRTYDALNRLLQIQYDFSTAAGQPVSGSPFEAFAYDGLGHVLNAKTGTTSVDIQVDSLGRATQETQTLGSSPAVIAKQYDSLGNPIAISYPSGRKVAATFDSASRLSSLTDIVGSAAGAPAGTPRRILSRDHIGPVVHTELHANGFRSAITLDATGRPAAVEWTDAGGTLRLGLTQLFDAAGNRAQDWQTGSEASATPSLVYAYDGVNWLTEVATSTAPAPVLAAPITPSPPQVPPRPLSGQAAVDAALSAPDPAALLRRYSYDADGNRISEIDAGGPSTLYTSDGLDRDLALAEAGLYDADGNTLVTGDVRRFDAHDRLVAGEGGFQAEYDGLGRRILAGDGSTQRRIIYDGNSEIASYLGADLTRLDTESVVGNSVDERLELAQAGHTYVVHRDSVGSIRMLTDESGGVPVRLDFDPYGRELHAVDPLGLRYRFMGRELDHALAPALYHFRARHYDTTYGRFIQRDPAESSPERSAYQAFAGNPLLYVDPMGTAPSAHIGEIMSIQGEDISRYIKSLPNEDETEFFAGLNLPAKDPKEPGDRFDVIRFRTKTNFALWADWFDKLWPPAQYGIPPPTNPVTSALRLADSVLRSFPNAPYHLLHGLDRASNADAAATYGLHIGDSRLYIHGRLELAKGIFESAVGGLTILSVAAPIATGLRTGGQLTVATEGQVTFATEEQLAQHFTSHGPEFGYLSEQEYLAGANQLIRNPDVAKFIRPNGDILYYHIQTNQFAAQTAGGVLRTYFRPIKLEGFGYWITQVGWIAPGTF